MKLGKNIALLSLVLAAATVSAEQFNCKDSDRYIKISTAEEFFNIGKDDRYPDSGRYCIVNDLNFSGNIYNDVLISDFSGYLVGAYHDKDMKHAVRLKNLYFAAGLNSALIGKLSGGRLDNIHIQDSTFATYNSYSFAVKMQGNSHISNSSVTNSQLIGKEVAGLVGRMFNNSIIENSYADIKIIKSIASGYASGLVLSLHDGEIKNNYATGTIVSVHDADVGISGLIVMKDNGIVVNNYASFDLEMQTNHHAGLIDYSAKQTCYSSYWDKKNHNGAKDTLCIINGQETYAGKVTNEMKQQSTYVDWDFDNVWRMGENGYPDLRSNSRDR